MIVVQFSPKLEVSTYCSYAAQCKVLWNAFYCCWVYMCRQTDRQTDRQTGRQTDRQTDRHSKANRHCLLWICWRHTQFISDTHTHTHTYDYGEHSVRINSKTASAAVCHTLLRLRKVFCTAKCHVMLLHSTCDSVISFTSIRQGWISYAKCQQTDRFWTVLFCRVLVPNFSSIWQ